MNRIEIAIYFIIIPWFHDSMNDWRVIMMKWESDKGGEEVMVMDVILT